MSQGKQIRFNLTADEWDLVRDFTAAVRTNPHKVGKHMLLIGIQNYMRAAEAEKKRREKELSDGNTDVGISARDNSQAQVSGVADTSPSGGETTA